MEVDAVQAVVASNFMRSYRIKAANEQEYQKLPNDIKKMLNKATLQIGG